jgi:hypothetical protein
VRNFNRITISEDFHLYQQFRNHARIASLSMKPTTRLVACVASAPERFSVAQLSDTTDYMSEETKEKDRLVNLV